MNKHLLDYRIRINLQRSKFFYKLYYFLTRGEIGTKIRSCNLVIDGYPRSANQFARALFLTNQPNIVLPYYMHVAWQVKEAAKIGKPSLILIREPIEAIVSWVIRKKVQGKEYNIPLMIKEYLIFYREVLKVKDRVLICGFKEITENPRKVIKRIDQVYNTNFGNLIKEFPNRKKGYQIAKKLDKYKVNRPEDREMRKIKKETEMEVRKVYELRRTFEIYKEVLKNSKV